MRLPLLIGICGFLFFHRLGERELNSSHEARAAQNAQMILSEGDWALPRLFDGRVELQKPPLYYWLVASLAWLRGVGVDELAVRLPSALAALGCVLFLYFLMCRCGRSRAGFVAALILATCVHFTWLARVGRIDMPLTFAITLALGSFYLGQRNSREQRPGWWAWFLLGYIAIAVGVVLKGPIAAILPFAVAGIHLAAEWRLERLRKSERLPKSTQTSAQVLGTLTWGIPVVLSTAVPWFLWANSETDNRLWEVFFWHHNVERAVSGTLVSHPWWFYGPRLMVDLMPWSLVPFVALCCRLLVVSRSPRTRHAPDPTDDVAEPTDAPDAESRFGLTWLLTMIVILSLVSFKRADYLLPAYPGFALWLGCRIDRWLSWRAGSVSDRRTGPVRLLPASLVVTIAACLIGWTAYLEWVGPHNDGQSYRRFAEEIRRRTSLPVIFFRVEAHELAFHVGRPLDTILEWENLDWWATRPEPIYIVMPPDCAGEWRRHLQRGRLEVVLRTTDLTPHASERPLVLVRSTLDTEGEQTSEVCETSEVSPNRSP